MVIILASHITLPQFWYGRYIFFNLTQSSLSKGVKLCFNSYAFFIIEYSIGQNSMCARSFSKLFLFRKNANRVSTHIPQTLAMLFIGVRYLDTNLVVVYLDNILSYINFLIFFVGACFTTVTHLRMCFRTDSLFSGHYQ